MGRGAFGDHGLDAAVADAGHERLKAEAERLKRDGALGRSDSLLRLFDYLLERTLTGRSPKEVEVAMDVFGRPADFEPGRDAVARVYAHKLRQRLQTVYAARPDHAGPRLAVPRGEYRLVLEAPPAVEAPPVVAPAPVVLADHRLRRWAPLAAALLAVAMVSSALTVWAVGAGRPPAARELARVRSGPVWGPLLANRRPTVIVLGDYYIFGESDAGMGVDRLVREYTVNSREELAEYLMSHPEKEDHYVDLDLRYLPIGAGAALRRIAPVLASSGRPEDVRVVMMSELTPAMLRADNVVYVGYLSGMGWLRDVALGGSRFTIGDTFDDIDDRRTRARYASQGGPSDEGRGPVPRLRLRLHAGRAGRRAHGGGRRHARRRPDAGRGGGHARRPARRGGPRRRRRTRPRGALRGQRPAPPERRRPPGRRLGAAGAARRLGACERAGGLSRLRPRPSRPSRRTPRR